MAKLHFYCFSDYEEGKMAHTETTGDIVSVECSKDTTEQVCATAIEAHDAKQINRCAEILGNSHEGVDLTGDDEDDEDDEDEYYEDILRSYTIAAENGNADACFFAGLCYQEGTGVEPDYTKAMYYYQKGKNLGEVCCINQLGVLYGRGLGVPKDVHKAIEYYTEAGERGEGVAYCNIGVFYDIGDGVQQNREKAIEYYELSAKLGYAEAIRRLQELRNPEADAIPSILNSTEKGNAAFVVEAKKSDECQVTLVSVNCNNLKPVFELLALPSEGNVRFGSDKIINEKDERNFLMIYNPAHSIPYPIVVVAKYKEDLDSNLILVDVEDTDLDVVTHIGKEYCHTNE